MAKDMFYPSLVVKKVQGYTGVWEARVDIKYRLTFQVEQEDGETICTLRNIDNHDECLKNP
jgi:mRNA-degrading endonuclease YafQ of YafQ-DinJ toxin-antitoxin module